MYNTPFWFYLFFLIAAIYVVKWSRRRRAVTLENAQRLLTKGQNDKAENMLQELVRTGSIQALNELVKVYSQTGRGNEAVAALSAFADTGYQPAGRMLAELYWEGKGMERDPAKAKETLLNLAENGDAQSQYMLAHYLREDGEAGKGKKWLELAAKNGWPDAIKEVKELR